MKNTLFIFIIISNFLFSQINIGGVPLGLDNSSLINGVPIITTPALNMTIIKSQDSLDSLTQISPRFGYIHNVNYTPFNSGSWKSISGGFLLWQLGIKCNNAKSINLVFSQYHLPVGAVLYIYNPNSKKKIGGFTSRNNKGTFTNPKKLVTGLVYGDEIRIELKVPSQMQNNVKLNIQGIVQGYRFIYAGSNLLKSGFGTSGNCMVNVNCPEGINWQNQKKGVALMIINGNRFGTGCLINNTSTNKELYFLTANHVIDIGGGNKDAINNPDASDFSFIWDYESSNCSNPTNEPNTSNLTTSGAKVIANTGHNYDSDMALLKLDDNPLDLLGSINNLYLAGWDRNTSQGAGGVCIHHPKGDIKKISTYSQIPDPNNSCLNIQSRPYSWGIKWISTVSGHSVIQPVSSGAPLFNNQGRIIGQLSGIADLGGSCGYVECDDPSQQTARFGKFSSDWDLNNTDKRRRLREWLDPSQSNVTSIDGFLLTKCSTLTVNNQSNLNLSQIFQDCIVTSSNTTITGGSIIFQVKRHAELQENFEVKNGAEFEINTW